MHKSQNFCQSIKADRKLALAVFLIGISILNVFIRASWGFYASAETSRTEFEIHESKTIENETIDTFFENQKNDQKLHFTTLPTENHAK